MTDGFDGKLFLEVSEHLKKQSGPAFHRAMIGRAYYALFWVAREHAEQQRQTWKHLSKSVDGGTHAALRELYNSKPGDETAKKVGAALKALSDLRQSADYDDDNEFGVDDRNVALTAIKDAETAIGQVSSVVWSTKGRSR